ncbi:MAG TPA: hypothetical protein VLK33_05930 [Terriglobales bacterium]|nr:hypothetical protein [Terriglobales bacterium]
MSKDTHQKLLQASSYLPLFFVWAYALNLEGTEFSGGMLTGPLLHMNDVGTFLLILPLVMVWFLPRIAGIIGAIAALLCLPLFLYFTVPGIFRSLFTKYPYSVPLQSYLVWDTWAILGIVFVAVALLINLRRCFSAGN